MATDADFKATASQGARFGRQVVSETIAVAFAETGSAVTRAAGSFVDDGFEAGQILTASVGEGTKRRWYTITEVSALTLTLLEDIEDETSASNVLDVYQPILHCSDINGPSGDRATVDVSHLMSTRREKVPGLADTGSITLNGNFLPGGEKGQDLFHNDANSNIIRKYIIAFSSHDFWTFDGFAKPLSIANPTNDRVTFTTGVEVDGDVRRSWVAAEAA